MAVTLEEFDLKFKSEGARVAKQDELALAALDLQVKGVASSYAALAQASQRAKAFGGKENAAAFKEIGKQAQKAGQQSPARDKRADAYFKREAEALSKRNAEGKKHLDGLRDMIGGNQKAAQSAQKGGEALKSLGQGAQAAGGPLGAMAGRLGSLGQLGRAGWAGLLIAALAAIAAGALYAYAALAKFGMAAAAAARETRILGEAFTGSAALGDEFAAVVDQLAGKVPLAKEQIAELAREMSLMRLARRDMQAALTGVAIVTSALGDSAGQAVKSIVSSSAAIRRFTLGARDIYGEYTALAGTGLKKADVLGALAKQLGTSLPEVEKRLALGQVTLKQGMQALEAAAQTRFGKTIAARMLSFDVQIRKAKENLANMFGGLKLEPVLVGLQKMLSVLDTSKATGSNLGKILTAGLQKVTNVLGSALTLAQPFFEGLIIGALEAYLAFRPILRAIGDLAGKFDEAGGASKALDAGILVGSMLGTAFGMVASAIGLVVAGLRAVLGPIVSVSTAAVELVTSFGEVGSKAATALGDGLVNGIKSIGSRVAGAASDLAASAAGAIAGVLKIGSPSKLMRQYGEWTGEGYAIGVENETPNVERAAGEMGGAAAGAASPGARGGGGLPTLARATAPAAGPSLTWNGDVYIGGQKGGGDVREQVRQGMLDAFTEAIGRMGAGLPAGAT